MDQSLEERIARIEAIEEIRQLASRYALAADMCDLDSLVELYVDDVQVSPGKTGRDHLKAFFAHVLAQFDCTSHHIGNHVIDFTGPDHAEGVVYCLAQHEMAGSWVAVQCMYHDEYERQGGFWLFRKRTPLLLYAVEPGDSPAGPDKVRWPSKRAAPGNMHDYSPVWRLFHEAGLDAVPPKPQEGGFLEALRRGQDIPRAQVPRD